MKQRSLFQKIENLPFAIFPTMVGAATLSNVYMGLGFTYIRHITMFFGALVFLCGLIKICFHSKTFFKEYGNTVPASLYAGLTMLLMILGAYVFDFNAVIGKSMWFAAIIGHALHILIFTYRNVIKGCNVDHFLPSWFVTYVGILVCNVVGGPMKEPEIAKFIAYYGLIITGILVAIMAIRIVTKPVLTQFQHTKAIFIAPVSLALVSYLNVEKQPKEMIVYTLYTLILIFLTYFLWNVPKFFSVSFHPGFAGMTFPMAIGIVASTKMVGFLTAQGQEQWASIVKEISGIQVYVTTGIIVFVLAHFVSMFVKSYQVTEGKND